MKQAIGLVCGIVLVKIIQTEIYKYGNGQKFIIRNVQFLTNSPYKVPNGLTIPPTVYLMSVPTLSSLRV